MQSAVHRQLGHGVADGIGGHPRGSDQDVGRQDQTRAGRRSLQGVVKGHHADGHAEKVSRSSPIYHTRSIQSDFKSDI